MPPRRRRKYLRLAEYDSLGDDSASDTDRSLTTWPRSAGSSDLKARAIRSPDLRVVTINAGISARPRILSASFPPLPSAKPQVDSRPGNTPSPSLLGCAARLNSSDSEIPARHDSLFDDRAPSPLTLDGYDMATGFQRMTGEARRLPSSSQSGTNRFENRPPMPNILCRNGPQCRKYQEGTCNYNHDFGSLPANGQNGQKKSLNVESPSFTPKILNAQPVKAVTMTSKAAAAPNFTPRASGAVTPASPPRSKEASVDFTHAAPPQILQHSQGVVEFVPGQPFVPQQVDGSAALQEQYAAAYNDPFLSQQLQQTMSALDNSQQQINPYAQASQAVGAQPFFQDATTFRHPLNYHLYASIGPKREKMHPYQRAASDFFISDTLREDLQRKSESTHQTFNNSSLPQIVEYFHSLVTLDTSQHKAQSILGFRSWVYKATSLKDGRVYALRRLEGFRLTSEAAIRTIQAWKRITNANVVQIHDAFTGRWFGDSSLVIVTDFHPLAQTLAEKHVTAGRQPGSHRTDSQAPPEQELWGYIVQLASAINAIHEAGLAAQVIHPSKILITAKHRLRINCCGVLDIIKHEQHPSLPELQCADLQDLGCVILSIITRTQVSPPGAEKALQLLNRSYSERIRACIAWLIAPPPIPQASTESVAPPPNDYTVSTLLSNIADKVVSTFDSTLQHEDNLTGELMKELENGRIARLLAKLNVILERPELSPNSASSSSAPQNTATAASLNQPSSAWSETGERYYLKLFRDYVFHQVDHDGRPVLDLGHIITCLNKLDAGIDEKIQLVSRDEQNCFVVSYREVKRGFESAWAEISKASSASVSRR